MSTTVRLDLDPTQRILLKRYINENGRAQLKFTKECEKQMNPYVPFLSGNLKDDTVTVESKRIIYKAPYAEKQYHTNQGMGFQGSSMGGLRGSYWDKRMWIAKGQEIVRTIADFVGGHV